LLNRILSSSSGKKKPHVGTLFKHFTCTVFDELVIVVSSGIVFVDVVIALIVASNCVMLELENDRLVRFVGEILDGFVGCC
jgi:hypothetical protein